MTPKERLLRLAEHVPDDASREEIIYRLRLFISIELGERDIEEGRVIDHDELFDKLLNPNGAIKVFCEVAEL